jgi:DNA-directed RNA polymerase specialized sigma24 family protein
MTSKLRPTGPLPAWVPPAVRLYLDHTAGGASLREIARREGVHASTVMRQVRRFESRRDDPLVDGALGRLQNVPPTEARAASDPAEETTMTIRIRPPAMPPGAPPGDSAVLAEARRLLPLLAAPGTLMAVAGDMDRAVVLRDLPEGAERLAVLERTVAEAFALRDWIVCDRPGRVARYTISPEGRSMLRKLGEAPARLRGAGCEDEGPDARFRPPPESPIAILARRRDAEGRVFLPPALVAAAERLREDYEVARLDPRAAAPDWPRVPPLGTVAAVAGRGDAVARLEAALAELGPGLGDVALRCCCRQEGVESAEQALGWSARSGKIVLRIALERLARFYEAQGEAPLIG